MQHPTSALAAVLFRETELGRLMAAMNEHGAGLRRLMDELSTSPTACRMRELNARASQFNAMARAAMTGAIEPENGK